MNADVARAGERDDAIGVAPHVEVADSEGEPEGLHLGRGRILRAAGEGDTGDEERLLVEDAGHGVHLVEVDVLEEEIVDVDLDDGRVVVDVASRPGQHRELDDMPVSEEGGVTRAELERQRSDTVATAGARAIGGVNPALLAAALAPTVPIHLLSRRLGRSLCWVSIDGVPGIPIFGGMLACLIGTRQKKEPVVPVHNS
jgi:hypothetical protein